MGGMSECEWDLKGTASGCLGYLFPCKALMCLEKEARYVLNVTGKAVKGALNTFAHLYSAVVKGIVHIF